MRRLCINIQNSRIAAKRTAALIITALMGLGCTAGGLRAGAAAKDGGKLRFSFEYAADKSDEKNKVFTIGITDNPGVNTWFLLLDYAPEAFELEKTEGFYIREGDISVGGSGGEAAFMWQAADATKGSIDSDTPASQKDEAYNFTDAPPAFITLTFSVKEGYDPEKTYAFTLDEKEAKAGVIKGSKNDASEIAPVGVELAKKSIELEPVTKDSSSAAAAVTEKQETAPAAQEDSSSAAETSATAQSTPTAETAPSDSGKAEETGGTVTAAPAEEKPGEHAKVTEAAPAPAADPASDNTASGTGNSSTGASAAPVLGVGCGAAVVLVILGKKRK